MKTGIITNRNVLTKAEKDFNRFSIDLTTRRREAEKMMKVVKQSGWQDKKFEELNKKFNELLNVLAPISKKMEEYSVLKKNEKKVLYNYLEFRFIHK